MDIKRYTGINDECAQTCWGLDTQHTFNMWWTEVWFWGPTVFFHILSVLRSRITQNRINRKLNSTADTAVNVLGTQSQYVFDCKKHHNKYHKQIIKILGTKFPKFHFSWNQNTMAKGQEKGKNVTIDNGTVRKRSLIQGYIQGQCRDPI